MSSGLEIAVLCGLAVALIAAVIAIVRRVRTTPEKRELKRRFNVNRHGRLGDATITEASTDTLYYSYSIHGVQYSASQDVSGLRDRLPAAPEHLFGSVSLKYISNNPANSILICEEWSGLRAPKPSPDLDGVGHQL
ncbi:MAG: hypothetical protein ACRD30_10810 [Bryobacteraceae bacterium]